MVPDPRSSQSELAQRIKVPPGSIQIKPGGAGRLIVLVPYAPERVAKMKTVAGRRWHHEEKYWTVPRTEGILADLLALFAGEPVELEPSLCPVMVLSHPEPAHQPEILQATGNKLLAPPKLLDSAHLAIRARHYSVKTEEAYIGWIKRFILFHRKRHPAEMGEEEIACFLSYLASNGHVSASTQNQALNALLFLYREVLRQDIGFVNGVVRAKAGKRLPVVLEEMGTDLFS